MLWRKLAARFVSAGDEITANAHKALRLVGDPRVWSWSLALVTGSAVSFQIPDAGGRTPSFPVASRAL